MVLGSGFVTEGFRLWGLRHSRVFKGVQASLSSRIVVSLFALGSDYHTTNQKQHLLFPGGYSTAS